MSSQANQTAHDVRTVADVEATIADIDTRLADIQAAAEAGDEAAPSRAAHALRERERAEVELRLARDVARSAVVVAAAKARTAARKRADELEKAIAAREVPAARLAARVVEARVSVTSAEAELAAYLRDEQALRLELDAALTRAGENRGSTLRHAGAPTVRIESLVEGERQRIAPELPRSEAARFLFGPGAVIKSPLSTLSDDEKTNGEKR